MPKIRLGRKLYGLSLATGSLVLLRSLVLQLFWPLAAADRSPPAIHQTFCSAQLSFLQAELLESVADGPLSVGASVPTAPPPCEPTGASQSWASRLEAAADRCADSEFHLLLARRLSVLHDGICRLTAERASLMAEERQALSRALRAAGD